MFACTQRALKSRTEKCMFFALIGTCFIFREVSRIPELAQIIPKNTCAVLPKRIERGNADRQRSHRIALLMPRRHRQAKKPMNVRPRCNLHLSAAAGSDHLPRPPERRGAAGREVLLPPNVLAGPCGLAIGAAGAARDLAAPVRPCD